jgi:hypothetical protein
LAHAPDFDNVYADGDDHGSQRISRT